MKRFASFGKKLQHLCSFWRFKLARFCRSTCFLLECSYRCVLLRVNPFLFHLFYFISLSFLGFWVLKVMKPRTDPFFRPRNLDLFFTSVSAATVSSMSTVEMEVFSNGQLIVLTILMLIGGEVFTSMVGLHLKASKLKKPAWTTKTEGRVLSISSSSKGSSSTPRNIYDNSHNQMELGLAAMPPEPERTSTGDEQQQLGETNMDGAEDEVVLRYKSIKFLGYTVLGYLTVVHAVGVTLVLAYVRIVLSARDVLKRKGIQLFTFSLFTTVSTFASCGYVPTNENMIVFGKNSGLLLLLIPQVLLGNTLFPSCLRFCVWVLGKLGKKKNNKRLEHCSNCSEYVLKKRREIGYLHLLPSLHSWLLVATVVGLIMVQLLVFCCMEWNSGALNGLDSSYKKLVGALFQCVNSRHSGETVVDLSIISPAVLVLFVVMMYLPPYTSFLPRKEKKEECAEMGERNNNNNNSRRRRGKGGVVVENILFSQLSYLVIFIILICITERKKMKEDPLNFSVLNIVVEVISAYGNVGFTTGYSCERKLKPDSSCQNKWFGFSGKWSDEGKIILILVMLFGRLKKFNMDGGRAWKLV
ncbi:probable cation transporter HKT1;4 [Malania oleifera]|uniref:probable cation transporter HKT1;4 n=1 Tax=Malania oleifera TaxID=397392 RepID=UPI0025AE9969|nr:probable cation transporter HKT1;4 [Malania oleifera]